MSRSALNREEYVEQAYFFRAYRERLEQNVPSQEILQSIQEEILATTRLPMAIDFMRTEIMHSGHISHAMMRLPHYFAPFQSYVMVRADDEESRFEQRTALTILEREAEYRATDPEPAGVFIFQFECLARNRLGYTDGLAAVADDPIFDDDWGRWIRHLRGALGSRELSELIYAASRHLATREGRDSAGAHFLFGEQEGRIARANIGRDPLYFFAALQRQLGYPAVPRIKSASETEELPAFLEARLNRIEQRLKLIEMEQKGGIDLSKFYRPGEKDIMAEFSADDPAPGNPNK